MSLADTESQRLAKEAAVDAAKLTPRMDDADRDYAAQLSLKHLKPPLKVPGFEQEQFLGRGAFGEVWKAVDSNSGRAVAIKFFSRRGGLDWSHMAREVEKLQFLFSDRHVVQLFAVGWESDPPYFVMELMAYGSLEDRLRQGPMSTDEAVRFIRETARGLVHAHDKGILHCDLKPSNIMLDQDGRPRLADFGQARLQHERLPALGTLFYMAPEQADLTAVPDARWDVYALGTILYRMITGKLPFATEQVTSSISSRGPVEERLKCYRESVLASPPPTEHRHCPGVDKALAEIIDRCLATDPKRRFRNVQSVLTALEMREARRSQKPLLLLGLLGPAIVVAVMGFAASYMFHATLTTAERQLADRTVESDQFAAKSVAARFGLEIDRRWRMLEEAATDAEWRRWLAPTSDAAAGADLSDRVQRRLEERHAAGNAVFSANTQTAYWFILDRRGIVRAISPREERVLGKYFGYREYFHGQGRELPADAPPPTPIAAAHRSNVFISRPMNRPSVALSVPIFADDGASADVVGILAMEMELGHFGAFEGTRHQFATLVDLRPDETGRRGLVVEHPYFARFDSQQRPAQNFYLSDGDLERIERLRTERVAAQGSAQAAAASATNLPAAFASGVLEGYADPMGGEYADDWLAGAEPILVPRGNAAVDGGWAIVVQERREDTLSPLRAVRSRFRIGGLTAVALVVLLIAALWGFTMWLINAPLGTRPGRFWRRQVPGVSLHGGSSLSTRSTDSAAAPEEDLSPPGGRRE